jgi:hypothetical protein
MQKSRVNFRSTKVDAGNLKRKYLNRPRSTLAVNVLSTAQIGEMPDKFIVFEECMEFKIETVNTVSVTTMSLSLSNFL